MSGPMMKRSHPKCRDLWWSGHWRSLGQNQKFFHFLYFWKGLNKLQGYACWKCKKSQKSIHPSTHAHNEKGPTTFFGNYLFWGNFRGISAEYTLDILGEKFGIFRGIFMSSSWQSWQTPLLPNWPKSLQTKAANSLISGATQRCNTINFHVALGITEICSGCYIT
jgi:hypothetical protein